MCVNCFLGDKHPMFQFAPVPRTRKSPYYDATVAAGCEAFTVYNHMLMPKWYESMLADYWYLINNVTMWDVAVERQIEITGPDAATFAQLLTPRDLTKCKVGQCKYVPIVDESGGMLNDPVLLKLGENHFWLSLADSDLLFWAKGLALGHGLDVTLVEPDVSPLAIQGPNWRPVAEALLGDWIHDLRFFWFREVDLDGIPLVVARSGWSKQGGLELYLRDGSKGIELWERVAAAGAPFDIKPAAPSGYERIETGLLSYGNDMTIENNPFECGLDKFCAVDKPIEFIGKEALRKVKAQGVKQRLVGLLVDHPEPISVDQWMPLHHNGRRIGKITSGLMSPFRNVQVCA